MMQGNGQPSVPPGFRFHPTDEELLYYYLRKKVSYEPIDLDVIRDVDLNKLEPWDIKVATIYSNVHHADRCRIGNGPQNEWYFFSRKDKKYPTGTRTNRATAAGFWKATGRDKAIHHAGLPRRIGMRKTLVFYIGRAPNGQKTDWIMHEYRLDDHDHPSSDIQEEGWVVCRVFKKKTLQRILHTPEEEDQHIIHNHLKTQWNQSHNTSTPWGGFTFSLDNSMHLPQLLSAETTVSRTSFMPLAPPTEVEGPQDHNSILHDRLNGDWTLLDKLLASHQNLNQLLQERGGQNQSQAVDVISGPLTQRFPMLYPAGCEGDILRLSK